MKPRLSVITAALFTVLIGGGLLLESHGERLYRQLFPTPQERELQRIAGTLVARGERGRVTVMGPACYVTPARTSCFEDHLLLSLEGTSVPIVESRFRSPAWQRLTSSFFEDGVVYSRPDGNIEVCASKPVGGLTEGRTNLVVIQLLSNTRHVNCLDSLFRPAGTH